ncbi:hypothetical protein fugu_013174 [Takifugu bimaculatus]|uniref:Shootin-1 n=1 Tax=Takifugu bimaculatus TaxID=433685 RepID=A0A4Z2C4F2_9TELE|nr:hypothetical protein fugu_013174 [Takifugu bimaculatus]
MMERIKHGVVLRPVKSQEIKTVKRSPSRGSQESCPSPPGKKDSELELILRRRRNKAGEAGSGDEGQMSHVTSSDSLNGRCTSSDLSRDPASPTALGIPSTPPVGPGSPGAGPEPSVVQRSSSGGSKEPGVEEEFFETPMSNGCFSSVDEKDGAQEIQSNGVHHDCGEEAAACADPPDGAAHGEC